MISGRFQPLSRELELAVRADLAPAERSRLIATVARSDIAQIDAANDAAIGSDVRYETTVDGARSAALETVNPDRGTIAAIWELQHGVVDFVWEMLVKHSPVLTGAYRASHMLFVDGNAIERPDPARVAKEWVVISGVPYARKIERGSSDQAPDGVYEGVAALARGRFGNLARVSFSFRSLAGGGRTKLEGWAARTKSGGRIRNDRRRAEWLRRQPAIVITML